ncbi:hypothetical protein T265_08212 [Opisthorchis viverrini]|uniref:Uncharacterized protein n=1 Tax=Opisthorchis viverrini TaxID=6198 RepID=A0A074ZEF4_OPIVI|nr:hypothetical protein T265_08212 [Opisthorchis viverrini]KER24042.1 hypothetical protein T265_08212 [Opisthorchis viverrini]
MILTVPGWKHYRIWLPADVSGVLVVNYYPGFLTLLMTEPSSSNAAESTSGPPVCIIVLGMAGSGKTTFVQRLLTYLRSLQQSVYAINLDPAVHHVPYPTNIDIRDTVKFKEVMKQYGFGPNGAIMTSLNFFASQFNKVVDLIHKNSSKVSYVVLDTPGQIEVFTWSASAEYFSFFQWTTKVHLCMFCYLSLSLKRVQEFLEPGFSTIFPQTDIIDCGFAIEWMRDFEAFQDALAGSRSTDGPIELEADSSSGNSGTSPYMTSLINSMSLVLDEFYNELRCCGVSSITGEGMDKLLQEINLATNEYHEVYVPMLCKRRSSRKAAKGEQDGTKECTHADSEVTTAKLAMGPLGPGRPKRSKNTRHMLVDMAGDNDEVEGDAMVELDGLEQRDSSESDELEDAIDGNFFSLSLLYSHISHDSDKFTHVANSYRDQFEPIAYLDGYVVCKITLFGIPQIPTSH